MRRTLTQQAARGGESDWGEQDLAQVANQLSKSCACTVEGLNLSVEFPLVKGAASAAGGDRETALFQLMADQPHPEVGGGLCCLLQMPQQVADKELLAGICSQLNRMEMAAADLAPHFGAWCPGKLGNNPAYVSFLPNALHGAPGLAEHTALCAMRRAAWAHQAIAAIRALC
jgi:hypothetical protein